MKPPVTVEAKVAEELRNWLASELEQLDASNTNQFAHHVVTILLHEDLDIEDEPLTTGDDFLRDIYNIKKGKTRERQKKAAVQFLRSAVCCDDPGEAEIQGVVDELMVKIEETKSKMNSKKSSKRSLLAPIAINVEDSANQSCTRSDSSEDERRYNEAFPSLPGEDSPSKDMIAPLNRNNNSVWKKSPSPGKENSKRKVRRRHLPSVCKPYFFSSQAEAQAWNTAWQVATSAIEENKVPHAEVADDLPAELTIDSSPSFTFIPNCWKSAFQAVNLTKIFIPKTGPLNQAGFINVTSLLPPLIFCPKVISNSKENKLETQDLQYTDGNRPDVHSSCVIGFHPIKEKNCQKRASADTDSEVDCILKGAVKRQEQDNETDDFSKDERSADDESVKWTTEIDEVRSFPSHFGDFFVDMTMNGKVCLYPEIAKTEMRIPLRLNRDHGAVGELETEPNHPICQSMNIPIRMMQKVLTPVNQSSLTLKKSINSKDVKTFKSDHYSTYMPETCGVSPDWSVQTVAGDDLKKRTEKPRELKDAASKKLNFNETCVAKSFEVDMNDVNANDEGNSASFKCKQNAVVCVEYKCTSCYGGEKYENIDPTHIADEVTETALVWRRSVVDIVESTDACAQSQRPRRDSYSSDSGCSDLSDTEMSEATHVVAYERKTLSFDKTVGGQPSSNNFMVSKGNLNQDIHEMIDDGKIVAPRTKTDIEEEREISFLSPKQCHWQGPFSMTCWDVVSENIMMNFREKGKLKLCESPLNLFTPSRLTSCLSTEGNQILERAFINSVFSTNFQGPYEMGWGNLFALHCSDLEQQWLKLDGNCSYGAVSSVVRGRTCSNWLENNCTLGLLCPFSHPSI